MTKRPKAGSLFPHLFDVDLGGISQRQTDDFLDRFSRAPKAIGNPVHRSVLRPLMAIGN
jgi:hypothetical protein